MWNLHEIIDVDLTIMNNERGEQFLVKENQF